MRNAKLTIPAALSLTMLAALAWGYVGGLALSIKYISVTSNGQTGRGVGAGVEKGQFLVGWQHSVISQSDASEPDALSPGLHVEPYYHFQPSLAPDWIWGFHIHRDSSSSGDWGGNLVCPIWFLPLLCTIAPIAWLRRRRRRETRGFAVEGSEQLSEGAEMQTDQQTPTGV